MKRKAALPRLFRAAGLGGAALAALLAASPAAAGQSRAMLSVTAVVAPACAIDRRSDRGHRAEIACSTGARVSTMTASRPDERPLSEAAHILGAPVVRAGNVSFTASIRPASAEAQTAESGTRYLTVTY